jgi:hypothetical protein
LYIFTEPIIVDKLFFDCFQQSFKDCNPKLSNCYSLKPLIFKCIIHRKNIDYNEDGDISNSGKKYDSNLNIYKPSFNLFDDNIDINENDNYDEDYIWVGKTNFIYTK